MLRRPDFSPYVAHFTKAGPVEDMTPDERAALQGGASSDDIARGRLASILRTRAIPRNRFWFGAWAVAFTECPWTSLIAHAGRYSAYGIGFSNAFLWDKGGNPVFYIRPEVFKAQIEFMKHFGSPEADPTRPFASQVIDFLTLFSPVAPFEQQPSENQLKPLSTGREEKKRIERLREEIAKTTRRFE